MDKVQEFALQESEESRQLRLQSSSTKVQIEILRDLQAQLEQEGIPFVFLDRE